MGVDWDQKEKGGRDPDNPDGKDKTILARKDKGVFSQFTYLTREGHANLLDDKEALQLFDLAYMNIDKAEGQHVTIVIGFDRDGMPLLAGTPMIAWRNVMRMR